NELFRFPYYRLQKGQKVCRFMNAQAFTEFPLSRISALAAFLDTLLIQVEKSNIPSHLISRLLILQFKNACERYRIPFVVAGIDNDALTAQMRMFCARNGIRQVDISQDLNQEGYRNLPHDTHPSALADEGYAKKLLTYLNRDVLESKP
ncbi:MAG: hypothetical protein WCG06_05980, partial [Candidatus Omnitrophota bacterium]